jgi:ribosome-binding factor A
MDENLKCIISPKLARQLIKAGFVVKDIRQNRDIRDATIFLFEDSGELEKIIENFKKQ